MTAITLSNINKRFGEKVLFRDYSLHIEAGEFVAIKGESGAGKTTLLNIIGLLEAPDSGSVTLCGARNPSFSSRAAVHLRRHKLSYLFQNYGLVDTDTVEANMKLATRFGKAKGKAEKERIADALAQVGLSGYERRKVYTLSGGEQQRVALAKIIAKSPDIILADEPTGSLDERNRSYVMDKLQDELHALGLGADDYLTKPCNMERLLARTKNLLRRREEQVQQGLLDGGGFLLDPNTFTIYAGKTSYVLPQNEGKILLALLKNSPNLVSKNELFHTLWGTAEFIDENALQVNFTRLRKTLREIGLEERIETVRGQGYRLKEQVGL